MFYLFIVRHCCSLSFWQYINIIFGILNWCKILHNRPYVSGTSDNCNKQLVMKIAVSHDLPIDCFQVSFDRHVNEPVVENSSSNNSTHNTRTPADPTKYTTPVYLHEYSDWLSMLKHRHVCMILSVIVVDPIFITSSGETQFYFLLNNSQRF